jgi:hypothetical protein
VRESYIIAKAGEATHRLDISDRDWEMLSGPYFKEGKGFTDALGVYEHFTVAGGIPKGSHVVRQRRLLLEAAELLRRGIERDEELLRFDYTFGFTVAGQSTGSGGESGFRIRGLVGYIDTRPRGFCWLQLSQIVGSHWPRVVEWIDMRVKVRIETDERGTLRIERKRAEIKWPERLPPFIEFLRSRSEKQITIEIYD